MMKVINFTAKLYIKRNWKNPRKVIKQVAYFLGLVATFKPLKNLQGILIEVDFCCHSIRSKSKMLSFFILIILVTFKKLKHCFKKILFHLKQFYFDLDPIKECNSVEEIESLKLARPFKTFSSFPWLKLSMHFVFPAVVMVYFHLDNIYVFSLYGGQYNATGMPELLTHRMTPDIFWDISDILIDAGNTQEMLIYLFMTQRPNINPDYFMFAVWNESLQKRTIYFRGKFWKQDKSDRILKIRSRLRRAYSVLIVIVFWQLYLYYLGFHHLNGDNFTVRNLWLYLYFTWWVVYTAYALMSVGFYFHLVTVYIQFKQQAKLNKMNSLMEEMYLVALGKHPNKNIPQLREIIWGKFCIFNRKVLALFKELGAYNHFWSFILTDYVFGYVIMICYLAYGFIFGEANSILKKSLYIFFSTQFFTTILLITSECTIIVRKNVALYKRNRQFAYLFSRTLQARPTQLLRLSKMISNYKGTRMGFRYINNGIIDSRMFEILFLSISVLFMKIFKKKIMGEDYIG